MKYNFDVFPVKNVKDGLEKFWTQHPALLYGFAALQGSYLAFYFNYWPFFFVSP